MRLPAASNPERVAGRSNGSIHTWSAASWQKATNSAPGDDRIPAGIVKVFWQWDKQRIVQLARACIRLGYHPKLWKTAKGVVIPKPEKPDYSKVRAYRVISLLDVISKLVERIAAHLIANHLERKLAYMMASTDVANGGPVSMQWLFT